MWWDEEYTYPSGEWFYRSFSDRRYWHVWENGVHTMWDMIMDDFGNLVSST